MFSLPAMSDVQVQVSQRLLRSSLNVDSSCISVLIDMHSLACFPCVWCRVVVGSEELGCTAEFVAVLATRGVAVDTQVGTQSGLRALSHTHTHLLYAYTQLPWANTVVLVASAAHFLRFGVWLLCSTCHLVYVIPPRVQMSHAHMHSALMALTRSSRTIAPPQQLHITS